MTLYILNYNNYYNRLVKREDSFSDYQPYILHTIENINFNPNDNLETEHIVGVGDYNGAGDYVLITDIRRRPSGSIPEYEEYVISRWFIVEAQRQRGGQWKLSLRRDIIADYKNLIMSAPCFVEKGYVINNSPLILNNENMTFNQIKMNEYLLDGGELKTPWLVAYLPRYDGEGNFMTWSGSFRDQPPTVNYTLSSLDQYKYYKYTNEDYIYLASNSGLYYEVPFKKEQGYNATYGFRLYSDSFKNNFFFTTESTKRPIAQNPTLPDPAKTWQECFTELQKYNTYDSVTGLATNTYARIGTYESYLTLMQEAGKTIQVGSGASAKFYKVVTQASELTYNFDQSTRLNRSSDFGEFLWQKIAVASGMVADSDAVQVTDVNWPYQNPGVRLALQEISNEDALQYSFNYTNIETKNTPYEILVAPYYNVTLQHGSTILAHQGEVALNWFMDMAKAGTIYDIQIVPFVGIDDSDISDYKIAQCYYSLADPKVQAWAIKLPYSQFSRRYQLTIPYDSDKKIGNSCDMYRLTSPNGIGNFDFNPAKNGGFTGYEIDCTLLPYNPYIKINPAFAIQSDSSQTNLYGGDFNDYRGLICGGDFSLPMVTSAWEEYQVNNKYYQQVFDRQNATLEYQNGWQLAENITGTVTGAAGGAVTGAAMGSIVPGIGTAAGAIVGGIAGAIGGIVDTIKGQAVFNESMEARRDQFGYQLGCIKARPETLSRTTAFNINNKYFPYIEYYTCTETEKQALRNKIKYNGMTVMVIGHLEDYLNPSDITFVKGKIIRLPDELNEDYHVAQAIVSEIQEGVYIV